MKQHWIWNEFENETHFNSTQNSKELKLKRFLNENTPKNPFATQKMHKTNEESHTLLKKHENPKPSELKICLLNVTAHIFFSQKKWCHRCWFLFGREPICHFLFNSKNVIRKAFFANNFFLLFRVTTFLNIFFCWCLKIEWKITEIRCRGTSGWFVFCVSCLVQRWWYNLAEFLFIFILETCLKTVLVPLSLSSIESRSFHYQKCLILALVAL